MLVYQRVTNQHRPTMYRTSSSHVVLLGTRPSAAKWFWRGRPVSWVRLAWGVPKWRCPNSWMVYNGKSYENPMKMDDLGIYVHIKDLLGFISSSKPGEFDNRIYIYRKSHLTHPELEISWSHPRMKFAMTTLKPRPPHPPCCEEKRPLRHIPC